MQRAEMGRKLANRHGNYNADRFPGKTIEIIAA